MECICVNNIKRATLRFERDELLSDIKNDAYIEWDATNKDNGHDKHLIADICEEGNIEKVTRRLDLTFAHAVELCMPYTKKWVRPRSSRNNEYDEKDEYVMYMEVPHTFSETTLDYMEELIHNLLVARVLEEWFSVTKPDAAEIYAIKASGFETEITSALTHRSAPITRKMNPF